MSSPANQENFINYKIIDFVSRIRERRVGKELRGRIQSWRRKGKGREGNIKKKIKARRKEKRKSLILREKEQTTMR